MWTLLATSGFAAKRKARADAAPQLVPLHCDDYRISVVMPVYSETETVRQIAEWLIRELGPRLHEIILVQSPRSSEASRSVCRHLVEDNPQVRLHVQRDNPGLGRALREGFALATGNLVLMMDSDGEMENETVPRMLAEMARGSHALVVASRWLPGGGFTGYSRLKYHLNWCFQQLFRCLFWTRLHDLTYGFKLIRAELVRGIDWQGTLHEIACETTLKPVRLGLSASEVPSKWTARTQGVSKNTFLRNFRYVKTACSILFRGGPFTPRHLPLGREIACRAENLEQGMSVPCGTP
jgi:dolichol-phosphate mannosyltransferase